MSLILVEHDTDEPALYGGMASALASRLGAALAHLPARFDTERFADAVQHATADGALVGSGLLWHERFTDTPVEREATLDSILARAARAPVVVPLHPAFTGSAGAELERRASTAGIATEHYAAVGHDGSFTLQARQTEVTAERFGVWTRDSFGRLSDSPRDQSEQVGPALRIGLVGAEADHHKAYPAVLAALGDAADAARLAVQITFIDPLSLETSILPELLGKLDGVLLPGGADMKNVPGQITVAHAALESRTPIVGLCLGMQTMMTAVAQRVLGARDVNLAEADPAARVKSFVAMAGMPGLPEHRLGDRDMQTEPGSCLAGWMGKTPSVRFNHRFRFNPVLLPDIRRAGLLVSAWDATRQIVDAVEMADHPFFVGLQGHPELSSGQGRPHPVLTAFLRSCRLRSTEPA